MGSELLHDMLCNIIMLSLQLSPRSTLSCVALCYPNTTNACSYLVYSDGIVEFSKDLALWSMEGKALAESERYTAS